MSDPKEIEILRAGTFTANNGTRHTFGLKELHEIAETYDPSYFKAPLIVSHKTRGVDDAALAESEFAYGFPSQLKVVGDRLKAVFEKVAPQFTQWVRDHQLLSISSSLYTPDSSANPYPGKWSLRHIAALGKEPPAIKGMAPLSLREFLDGGEGAIAFDEFNHDSDGSVEFNSADFCMNDRLTGQLMQKLREFLIEKHGKEVADETIPSDMVSFYMDTPALNPMVESRLGILDERVSNVEGLLAKKLDEQPNYSEVNFMAMNRLSKLMKDKGIDAAAGAKASGISEEKIKAYMSGESMSDSDRAKIAKALDVDETELMEGNYKDKKKDKDEMDMSELEAELAQLRAEKADAERKAAEYQLQLKRAEIQSFCESLPAQVTPAMMNAREVEFGEEKAEIGLVDFMVGLDDAGLAFMKSHLQSLPKQISFGEVAGGETPERPSVDGTSNEIADRIALDKKIREYAKSQGVSYNEAHSAVIAEISMGV